MKVTKNKKDSIQRMHPSDRSVVGLDEDNRTDLETGTLCDAAPDVENSSVED